MSEIPLSPLDQLHDEPQISRRNFVRAAGAALAIAAAPNGIRWAAEHAGGLYDTIASPEDIITLPIVALEPRANDEPVISPQPRSESVPVQTVYSKSGEAAKLVLSPATPLQTEHTRTPVTSNIFTSVGTGIITTVEGLRKGEQAYCRLFKSDKQLVAVGYEGGLYVYEPDLSQPGNNHSGEWVRAVTQPEEAAPPAPAYVTATWADMEKAVPDRMLVEDIVEGTETLRSIGYKPWAAILPSTQMPDMATLMPPLTPDNCAESITELLSGQNNKHYFITRQGEAIDVSHLRAKAGETWDLFAQLYYQQLANEPRPTASVRYSIGSDATFDFSVERASIQPDTILDTTFAIMNAESMLMEGIAQRYAIEKIVPGLNKLWPSGLSPEDLFTNSLGITGMLQLIREQGLAEKLAGPLRQIRDNNPGASAKDMRLALEHAWRDIRPLLAQQVVAQVAQTYGVRKQAMPGPATLPRGIYSLIPVKISDRDGATPHASTSEMPASGPIVQARTMPYRVSLRCAQWSNMRSTSSGFNTTVGKWSHLCYNWPHEFTFYRHSKVLTQLPFELRLEMPKPTSGRGYSDTYVAEIQKELQQAKSTDG